MSDDKKRPPSGRRPAPRRPAGRRPPPRQSAPPRAKPAPAPQDLIDDEDRTQAINLADMGLEPELIDEEDNTTAVEAAALKARAAKAPQRTLMGHPGLSTKSPSAVRGARTQAPRKATVAMGRAASPPPDDDDESTMAMNVDAMLAQIDAKAAPAAEPDDDDESTMAMNVDAMLAQIDGDDEDDQENESTMAMNIDDMLADIDGPGASGPLEEDESTMAVNMDDMLAQIDTPAASAGDDDEKTMAMSLDDVARIDDMVPVSSDFGAADAELPELDDDPYLPATTGPAPEGLGPAASTDGLFGPIFYFLGYDGRRQQIDDGIAALDAEIATGGGRSRSELQGLKQQYEGERAALNPQAAMKGWITLAAAGASVSVLCLVLGVIF